jgi:hypothetical protein
VRGPATAVGVLVTHAGRSPGSSDGVRRSGRRHRDGRSARFLPRSDRRPDGQHDRNSGTARLRASPPSNSQLRVQPQTGHWRMSSCECRIGPQLDTRNSSLDTDTTGVPFSSRPAGPAREPAACAREGMRNVDPKVERGHWKTNDSLPFPRRPHPGGPGRKGAHGRAGGGPSMRPPTHSAARSGRRRTGAGTGPRRAWAAKIRGPRSMLSSRPRRTLESGAGAEPSRGGIVVAKVRI